MIYSMLIESVCYLFYMIRFFSRVFDLFMIFFHLFVIHIFIIPCCLSFLCFSFCYFFIVLNCYAIFFYFMNLCAIDTILFSLVSMQFQFSVLFILYMNCLLLSTVYYLDFSQILMPFIILEFLCHLLRRYDLKTLRKVRNQFFIRWKMTLIPFSPLWSLCTPKYSCLVDPHTHPPPSPLGNCWSTLVNAQLHTSLHPDMTTQIKAGQIRVKWGCDGLHVPHSLQAERNRLKKDIKVTASRNRAFVSPFFYISFMGTVKGGSVR